MRHENPSPVRGAAKKALLLVLALVVVGAGGGGWWYAAHRGAHDHDPAAAGGEKVLYTCGMHPWIIADRPGDCPVCGMKLTRIDQAQPQDEPAQEDDFFAELEGREPRPPPQGYAAVNLGHQAVRLAGIQTVPVVLQAGARTIRAVGLVTPDEARVRHVHTKIEGWVEDLHVNFTGQLVKKGQPVLSLYSPELLATQEEYLRARATAEKFKTSPLPEVRASGESLAAMARKRLELFDVPAVFLAEIEKSGAARRAVTLVAPASGFVTAKEAFEGLRVEPGTELYTLTDLSRVWIEVDLYEYEAQAVAVGQQARVALPFDPSLTLAGRVTYVYPYLNPETRTLRVRLEFANGELRLKPGMYADVTLQVDLGETLAVPDSAVIDTGTRQIAFVEVGKGRFEPRLVKLGARSGGTAQVLSGLQEGDAVVIRANFLLDSESRLRAAIQGMTGGHQH